MNGSRALLVANRGEIAVRIFATCRRLGLRTIAVAGPGDEGALHTRRADATVSVASYLDPDALVAAAREAGARARPPRLRVPRRERANFAEAVLGAGLVWVGPPPSALRRGGDKLEAKRIAATAGVPTLPTGDRRRARLSSARQGLRRRRRPRDAPRRERRGPGRGARGGEPGGRGGLRGRHRLLRALPPPPPPRRGAAPRRPPRDGAGARRPRLLGAAAPPEGRRGVAATELRQRAAASESPRMRSPSRRSSATRARARPSSSSTATRCSSSS